MAKGLATGAYAAAVIATNPMSPEAGQILSSAGQAVKDTWNATMTPVANLKCNIQTFLNNTKNGITGPTKTGAQLPPGTFDQKLYNQQDAAGQAYRDKLANETCHDLASLGTQLAIGAGLGALAGKAIEALGQAVEVGETIDLGGGVQTSVKGIVESADGRATMVLADGSKVEQGVDGVFRGLTADGRALEIAKTESGLQSTVTQTTGTVRETSVFGADGSTSSSIAIKSPDGTFTTVEQNIESGGKTTDIFNNGNGTVTETITKADGSTEQATFRPGDKSVTYTLQDSDGNVTGKVTGNVNNGKFTSTSETYYGTDPAGDATSRTITRDPAGNVTSETDRVMNNGQWQTTSTTGKGGTFTEVPAPDIEAAGFTGDQGVTVKADPTNSGVQNAFTYGDVVDRTEALQNLGITDDKINYLYDHPSELRQTVLKALEDQGVPDSELGGLAGSSDQQLLNAIESSGGDVGSLRGYTPPSTADLPPPSSYVDGMPTSPVDQVTGNPVGVGSDYVVRDAGNQVAKISNPYESGQLTGNPDKWTPDVQQAVAKEISQTKTLADDVNSAGLTYDGHPLAPKIGDVIVDADGNPVGYYEDKIPGRSLKDLLNDPNSGVTSDQLAEIQRQTTEQLDLLHQNGFVHGDASAGNIMVDIGPDGSVRSVRLTDFTPRPDTWTASQDDAWFQNRSIQPIQDALAGQEGPVTTDPGGVSAVGSTDPLGISTATDPPASGLDTGASGDALADKIPDVPPEDKIPIEYQPTDTPPSDNTVPVYHTTSLDGAQGIMDNGYLATENRSTLSANPVNSRSYLNDVYLVFDAPENYLTTKPIGGSLTGPGYFGLNSDADLVTQLPSGAESLQPYIDNGLNVRRLDQNYIDPQASWDATVKSHQWITNWDDSPDGSWANTPAGQRFHDMLFGPSTDAAPAAGTPPGGTGFSAPNPGCTLGNCPPVAPGGGSG
jgi:serine/threonine protein kinase